MNYVRLVRLGRSRHWPSRCCGGRSRAIAPSPDEAVEEPSRRHAGGLPRRRARSASTERLLDPVLGTLAGSDAILPLDVVRSARRTTGQGRSHRPVPSEQVVGAKMLLPSSDALARRRRRGRSDRLDVGASVVGVGPRLVRPRSLSPVEATDGSRPSNESCPTCSISSPSASRPASASRRRWPGSARTEATLSGEFARSLQDIRLGVSRIEALDGLAERTKSTTFGTCDGAPPGGTDGHPAGQDPPHPIRQLRVKRKLRAEEAALQAPGQDDLPTRPLHPARPFHRDPRPGRHPDLRSLRDEEPP